MHTCAFFHTILYSWNSPLFVTLFISAILKITALINPPPHPTYPDLVLADPLAYETPITAP